MPKPAQVAVVVPIRSFRTGMARLAAALDSDDRAALARKLATGVLETVAPLSAYVVTSDPEVIEWAQDYGAIVLADPGSLNAAADAGRAAARDDGATRVVIAHADLARPKPLAFVADFDGVTIVPDRHGGGTNVLCVPTAVGFAFAYGDGSRYRHETEARARALPLRVLVDADLGWDVDDPSDLV